MGTVVISGVTYTVYGDQPGAKAYFQSSSHGAPFLAASTSVQNQSLVTATRAFERTRWAGAPTDPVDGSASPAPGTQPLQWPRTGLVDTNGQPVPSTSIPAPVIYAAYEYAMDLITNPAVQTTAIPGDNVKVDKLTQRVEGAVTVSTEKQYFRSQLGAVGPYPTIVMDYIGLWLGGSGGIGDLFYYGATDAESTFAGNDDFGYSGDGIP